MKKTLLILIVIQFFVNHTGAYNDKETKTLLGNEDKHDSRGKSLIINAESSYMPFTGERRKRSSDPAASLVDETITKVNHFNDTHKQLMVHWVSEKSGVVICLARDPAPLIPGMSASSTPSSLFISYDDGDHYENKTESFKGPDGKYATLDKFYNHPKFHNVFVFSDTKQNVIYVTSDHGRNIERRKVNFSPSEISFHEAQSGTFVILDKNDTNHKLWITEDSGKNFRVLYEFVKSFYLFPEGNGEYQLIVQRMEPNNLSSVMYYKTAFRKRHSQIYATGVKDLFFKGDFLFTTRYNSKGDLNLFVSYKLGKQQQCVFDSMKKNLGYFVVDVTETRALIAVSHSNTSSNLYVSENLGGTDGEVRFSLSLKDVFAFLPGMTWQNTWLHHLSEDAFADVYKVEGLQGIYIASKLTAKVTGSSLGPQHLGSVITFDHGATWRKIRPPATDVDGQSTGCTTSRNCSLHLSQKFSQLFPETRSVGILSSKSAPGVIMATGVLGRTLKGHYGVYISLDAGLTWRQTLRDLFFFNMGDHGCILSAVRYYKSKGETRNIEYSIDEGETWNKTTFHNEELKLYGLMTEPGENTTVFTMFGSLPAEHQWIVVKVDLRKVFNRTCVENDYKMWSPGQSSETRSYIPCLLGQQTTFQRRIPRAQCLNGLDYVRVVSKQPCYCDFWDFECDFGFVKVETPYRCISSTTHEAQKVPANCKPGRYYNRTKGYIRIAGDVCVGGFESHYLPDLVPCPIKEMDDFLLFAQRERISRYNLVTKKLEELPVTNLKNVIAIDFDMASNCLYWADITEDTIGRQCYSNGSKIEVLVSTELSSIEGMAFDWISKTLYFVDGVRAKIELIRTDVPGSGHMRRTILNSTVLNKPRGIVLHPQNGYLFWTDWSADNPSINRANLDGTHNLTLFGSDTVEWPNGITVDYMANRLYWVDAKMDYIGSSDLHGDGFVKIISNNELVSHPFAVAVFKNAMFWDDWKRNSIFSSDKDHFQGVDVILKQMPGLMDLKVFAHGLQIGTNACTNSTCSHICVGLPNRGHECLCPDGLSMKDGACVCPGGQTPFGNLTCPTVADGCSADQFKCGNKLCVPKGWRCDGEDDCGDNSDEGQCASSTCPPSFFSCADGKCLPHYWRCDFDRDCADGSDELECPKVNCTENQFACENGLCISRKWKCDGENDCRDGSDERNCNAENPTTCKNDEYHCKSGGITCIPITWKCDNEPDCGDASDELNCANNTCSDSQMSCGPPLNKCIYKTWVCDGDSDCPDGKDEANCTTPKPESPKMPNDFLSKNGSCQDWMFVCKNSRCIPFWWKCDGVDDCLDNSDEVGCFVTVVHPTTEPLPPLVTTQNVICDANQFQCSSGGCIKSSWVCDGSYDCLGGEDENNCNSLSNCSSSQFKCQNDGSCVSLSVVCNGKYECPDGSDEQFCEHNLPGIPVKPVCNYGLFACDNVCYPLSYICDGKVDCRDMTDEINCTKLSKVYQVMQLDIDERGTNDTSLYLLWWIHHPEDLKLEFQPSIKKIGEGEWSNASWTSDMSHRFTGLEPFTKYNMTVYVRLKNSDVVYPPAVYNASLTGDGVPGAPWNVTAKQRNVSHILVSWQKPRKPRGVIVAYEIVWSGDKSPEIKLRLTGNETAHLLSPDFEHGVAYTFWVIAHNRRFMSNRSEPTTLTFDGKTDLSVVNNVVVVKETDEAVSLSWDYSGDADGFNVRPVADRTYPEIPVATTKTKNVTMKLAPGTNYRIEFNAFKKTLVGPTTTIAIVRSGKPLPEISISEAVLLKVGTTVKLGWERPKYGKKLNWMYGIYYGTNQEQLFEKPRFTTMNETATITNLEACETFIFCVGIIGPIGYGPLSGNFKQVTTSGNMKAPPKRIQVAQEGDNPLKMRIQWVPSCPTASPEFYSIQIRENTTTQTWHRRVNANESLSRVFDVSYGGVYEVKMASGSFSGPYSKPVTYRAPSILPPYEIRVQVANNGSYVVAWKESSLPTNIGRFGYEVLVHEGNAMEERSAQKFLVDKPPFVYTNSSFGTYTFAVRIKTGRGLNSITSEAISREIVVAESSSMSLGSVVACSVIIVSVLLAVIVVLAVRFRRLQGSFTRFTNTHYDTRSEAATFDERTLEEDESPQIRGFSDDEPLVIA